jgi:carboxylesterase type B
VDRICPQASPLWSDIQQAFLLTYFNNQPFTLSTNISAMTYKSAKPDPRTTEDCLFLDVVVPKKIFDRTKCKDGKSRKNLAPVLVWIYGGGYVGGEKSGSDPTGLIQRSMGGHDDGIVYVALNYRVSKALSPDRYPKNTDSFCSWVHLAGLVVTVSLPMAPPTQRSMINDLL